MLGGGGARGGAHIGVLRVLRDAGYSPDIIVGTSMGALIAVLTAAGVSLTEIEDILCSADLARVIYPDRAGRGLIGSDRIRALLERHLGSAELQDLNPRIAVMATDLRKHQRILIDGGPAVTAVLASIAVPGLFPPVEWKDCLLVDGGVLDNVPTQAAYQLGARSLIAVDVGGGEWNVDFALQNVGALSKQISRALYWLLGLSHRRPVFDVWVQSAMLVHEAITACQLSQFPPDILIRPALDGIGLFSMERIPEAIRAGESAGRDVQREIERLTRRVLPRRRTPLSTVPLMTIQL